MSSTIVFDPATSIATIATGGSLHVEDRISIMDRIDRDSREPESTSILLDVRELDSREMSGVKNLVVQLGLRRYSVLALVGSPLHDETLRRIVHWFPFGTAMNVFSSPDSAREWLAHHGGGVHFGVPPC